MEVTSEVVLSWPRESAVCVGSELDIESAWEVHVNQDTARIYAGGSVYASTGGASVVELQSADGVTMYMGGAPQAARVEKLLCVPETQKPIVTGSDPVAYT